MEDTKYNNEFRQIVFMMNAETLTKIKALKLFHRCRNQSELLTKLVNNEVKRLEEEGEDGK